MIISKIRGGMGNQLFTYAAGRSLALTHDVPLVLDVSWYLTGKRELMLQRFDIVGEISSDDHSGADDGVGYNQEEWGYHPSFERYDGRRRFLSGWWQSEKFFARHADRIRRDLTISDPVVVDDAARRVDRIRAESGGPLVSVHCRRGDYVALAAAKRFVLLEEHWFEQAMGRFPDAGTFVMFSDDPAWCQEHFGRPDIVVIDAGDDLVEFEMMRRCDHHVISNSTFSWWAAWLGETGETRVVSPPPSWWGDRRRAETRIGNDLVPDRWEQLPPPDEAQ